MEGTDELRKSLVGEGIRRGAVCESSEGPWGACELDEGSSFGGLGFGEMRIGEPLSSPRFSASSCSSALSLSCSFADVNADIRDTIAPAAPWLPRDVGGVLSVLPTGGMEAVAEAGDSGLELGDSTNGPFLTNPS